MKGLRIVLVTLAVVVATSATFVPREREQDDQFEMDNVELAEKGEAEEDNDFTDRFIVPTEKNNAITGGVYIRWGKFGCPTTATKVYEGIAGAAKFDAKGGGSNYLCLSKNPQFDKPQSGIQQRSSKLFPVEYRTDYPPLKHVCNHDVPCVACQAKSRRVNVLMIPGRRKCPDGWTLEYNGYLMSERGTHFRTEYVCVDKNPKGRQHTQAPNPETALGTMQTVEGVCSKSKDGFPCDKYVSGNELTCAVCSK